MRQRFLIGFCLSIFPLALFGLFFTPSALAQVVINEVCANCNPEWVELFNTSPTDPIDLEGWEVADSDSTADLTITITTHPTTIIQPHEFFTIYYKQNRYWLNNDEDEVSLFDNSPATDPIDNYPYLQTTKNKTFSRIPDGTGDFVLTDPTPDGYNEPPPIPTPTPEPDPTETTTPTQTQPTSSPTPTLTPTKKITPTTSLASAEEDLEDTDSPPLVLGEESTPEPTPTEEIVREPRQNKTKLPIWITLIGGLLLASGLGVLGYKHYLTTRRSAKIPPSDK